MAMGEAYASVLTPRLQQALEKACRKLLDAGFEDLVAIRERRSDTTDNELVTYLPGCYLLKYTYAFLQDFLLCVAIVGWKLAQPTRIKLSCVAEELAAHALITEADLYLDRGREKTPIKRHFDALEAQLYDNSDFLRLFEGGLFKVEESQRLAVLGNPKLLFEHWFDPFVDESSSSVPAVPPYLGAHKRAKVKRNPVERPVLASHTKSIPTEFGAEFLDWFKERLEAAWAALPQRTPQDVLAEYVGRGAGGCAWQAGTRWLAGLSEEEVADVERSWQLTFPPDYRLFLRRLHSVDRPSLCAGYLAVGESPQTAEAAGALATAHVEQFQQYMVLQEGPSFYNWLTDADALEAQFARLWEGLQFDVEHNHLWPASWGTKPTTRKAQRRRVRELVEAAPRLIPVFEHRYLLAEPCVAGNPVFSVWQSDIVVYGANLRDYPVFEFSGPLGLERASTNARYRASNKELEREIRARVHTHFPSYQAIPFWGELLTH